MPHAATSPAGSSSRAGSAARPIRPAGPVPNITGGEGGLSNWSADDIASFLETGFTPDYNSVGGTMAEVQENMAMLVPDDRAAIGAYLKAVPPLPCARRGVTGRTGARLTSSGAGGGPAMKVIVLGAGVIGVTTAWYLAQGRRTR